MARLRGDLDEQRRPRAAGKTEGLARDLDVYIDTVVQQTLQPARTRWFKSFIEYDPGRDLQEVTIPVLALFGGLDTQVPEQMNQKAVEAALEAAGNPNHATIVFPQANHLFQFGGHWRDQRVRDARQRVHPRLSRRDQRLDPGTLRAGGRYPFSDPSMTPFTKYFCTKG